MLLSTVQLLYVHQHAGGTDQATSTVCLSVTVNSNQTSTDVRTASDITVQYFITILLLATSFGLNGPTSGQYLQTKLKNVGAYSTETSILWDPCYNQIFKFSVNIDLMLVH
jgi:hypothetical protein